MDLEALEQMLAEITITTYPNNKQVDLNSSSKTNPLGIQEHKYTADFTTMRVSSLITNLIATIMNTFTSSMELTRTCEYIII